MIQRVGLSSEIRALKFIGRQTDEMAVMRSRHLRHALPEQFGQDVPEMVQHQANRSP